MLISKETIHREHITPVAEWSSEVYEVESSSVSVAEACFMLNMELYDYVRDISTVLIYQNQNDSHTVHERMLMQFNVDTLSKTVDEKTIRAINDAFVLPLHGISSYQVSRIITIAVIVGYSIPCTIIWKLEARYFVRILFLICTDQPNSGRKI